jgi:hypothetical protein
VGLTHPESQWLYIISDPKTLSNSMSAVTSLLSEGQNIAFTHDSGSSGKDCEVRNQSDPSDDWNQWRLVAKISEGVSPENF